MQYFCQIHFDPDVQWPGPGDTVENFKAELNSFGCLPDRDRALAHIWAPFHAAVYRQIPTIWCCRNHHVSIYLFLSVCIAAEVSPADIMNVFLTKGGMENLAEVTRAAGGAPLQMFDATDPEGFFLLLASLESQNSSGIVYCDWMLDEWENKAATTTAKRLNTLFVMPAK